MSHQEALTRKQVSDVIPHRDPFLFLEDARVVGENAIEGTALWHAGHPILSGHFPGRPIVPGVCQIEALAQLAGVLIAIKAKSSGNDTAPRIGMLASVRSASFHRPVQPDEPLAMECRLRYLLNHTVLVEGSGRIGKEFVFKSQFLIFTGVTERVAA